MTATFRVDLRPSRKLAALVVCGHLGALASVWVVLPAAAAAAVTAGIGVSLAGFFRLRGRQPRALVVGPGAGLGIVDREGEIRTTEVAEARVPVWWLAMLRVAGPQGRRETLCLLDDSTDAESLRRLRAWMLGPLERSPADGARDAAETKDPWPA